MNEKNDCIFCSIAAGTTPADIISQTDDFLFIRDIAPQASVHILGITKKHLPSLHAMAEEDHDLIGRLLHEATHVADEQGIAASGYRIITNIGADAGQDVHHLHMHLLGGEALGPLRC